MIPATSFSSQVAITSFNSADERSGEIFISTETARRQAGAYRVSLKHELQMYLVHGLLHLIGFDDKNPSGARKMRAMQERISRDASKTV